MDNSSLPAWLKALRGTETQEDLARDITAVTGWPIDRSRYSKYESGSLPIGPKVRGHFLDYWQSRGKSGPEASPQPAATAETPNALVSALQAQTAAINALVATIQKEREEGRDVATAFDRAAAGLLEVLRPGGSGASAAQSVRRGSAG